MLVVDNYDSFTFNIVQYLRSLGAKVEVRRNDAVSVREVERMSLDGMLLSPGPGGPDDAGITLELVRRLAGRLPLLGVCLGHQAIGAAYGAEIVGARRVMHGKASVIHHDGTGVFCGVESPFRAIRYNSLLVRRESLPECLRITAWTDSPDPKDEPGLQREARRVRGGAGGIGEAQGSEATRASDGPPDLIEVMGLAHRELEVEGVQFHPESVLSEEGRSLFANWLSVIRRRPQGFDSKP